MGADDDVGRTSLTAVAAFLYLRYKLLTLGELTLLTESLCAELLARQQPSMCTTPPSESSASTVSATAYNQDVDREDSPFFIN